MKQLINKVQLIGNLVCNPSCRVLESGKQMARFSMATSEVLTRPDGSTITETQWHNLVAYDAPAMQAERCLAKGTRVAVIGRLISRKSSSDAGPPRWTSEVVINELLVLSSRKSMVFP